MSCAQRKVGAVCAQLALINPCVTLRGKTPTIGYSCAEIRANRCNQSEINRMRKQKSRRVRKAIELGVEIECALVKTAGVHFLTANTRSENGFEHLLLKPGENWIFFEQIQDRRMTF